VELEHRSQAAGEAVASLEGFDEEGEVVHGALANSAVSRCWQQSRYCITT
jgi:hypothetical protein